MHFIWCALGLMFSFCFLVSVSVERRGEQWVRSFVCIGFTVCRTHNDVHICRSFHAKFLELCIHPNKISQQIIIYRHRKLPIYTCENLADCARLHTPKRLNLYIKLLVAFPYEPMRSVILRLPFPFSRNTFAFNDNHKMYINTKHFIVLAQRQSGRNVSFSFPSLSRS